MIDLRVISIGALPAHPLRDERTPVRPGHSTCTLLRAGDKAILVDPGLPDSALASRLDERVGLPLSRITHVFLTSFNPELRRALPALDHATWWISETEREAIGAALVAKLHEAAEENDDRLKEALEREVAILRRCQPAPDHLADHRGERLDLFPLPGVTPGLCGLILAGSRFSTLICGDAIPTVEHLEQGKVLPNAADVDRARESFAEAIEIADLLVLGRDNVAPNPSKRVF
ncbi:MAG: MBL fold metallo-hydrolase [Phycisphaerae bacterium]|nr:MBL fold metallo-hydrolase [Phycisphaerae bacterium]